MEDGDHCQQFFQPIRRINQACNSCRRRKARCSGHRPRCTTCRRLSIDCEYACNGLSRSERQTNASTEKPIQDQPADVSLTLTSLRADVSELQDRLQSIVECQQQMLALLLAQNRERTGSTSSYDGSYNSDRHCYSESNGSPKPEQTGSDLLFQMIRSPMIEQLIDVYFDYCHNRPYSFFHEGNLRQALATQEVPDYLLLAIVATTVRFAESLVWTDQQEIAAQAATCSWKIINEIYLAKKDIGICVIQTLALLSIFDFTAGKARHSSAWVKMGIAIRLAQNMKLMLQPPVELSFEAQEERRRVFWSLYLFDRLASCGRRHPATISDSTCQLQLPCDEESWRNGVFTYTTTLSQVSEQHSSPLVENAPFARVLLLAQLLGRATCYMFQGANESNMVPAWDHKSELAAMQSTLIYLEPSLSLQEGFAQLALQKISVDGQIDQSTLAPLDFSHTLYHLCYCVLNHPFLLNIRLKDFHGQIPKGFLSRSSETAYEHAKQIILQIDAAKVFGCKVYIGFYSYVAIFAGSILALYANDASEALQFEANSLQQRNIAFMEELAQCWKHTATALSLLQKLIINQQRFAVLTSNTRTPARLSSIDEEFMWTLLDYNEWCNMGPDDVTALRETEEINFWPDINISVDAFCNGFPHLEEAPGQLAHM